MSKPPRKHVIILGAGASMSSGYPDAKGLRQRLQSIDAFLDHLLGNNPKINSNERQTIGGFLRAYDNDIGLLRRGGFGSTDEFCFMSKNDPSRIVNMKRLTALCLAAHSPELKFTDSEYYGFIQKLFEEGTSHLRKDIAVLSFNYDPYLEYLLERAVRCRLESLGGNSNDDGLMNQIHGGMWSPQERLKSDEFMLLKLHGTIAPPQPTEFHPHGLTELINTQSVAERLGRVPQAPPIYFPWEMGGFKGSATTYVNHPERVWTAAIQQLGMATRISLVGLSVHKFLEDGFKRLFSKVTLPQVVVCNKDTVGLDPDDRPPDRTSPGRLIRLFASISKDRRNLGHKKPIEYYPVDGDFQQSKGRMTYSSSFEDFITNYMDPLVGE